MLAGLEAGFAAAGDDDRDVSRIVGVAVADRRAEGDHRVVEQAALAFLDVLHPVEHVGILLDVPAVDLLVLVELLAVVAVVGEVVVAAVDAFEEGEIPAGDVVAEHEGRDAGGVRPEGEDHQIHHDPAMLAVVEARAGVEFFLAAGLAHRLGDPLVEGVHLLEQFGREVFAGTEQVGLGLDAAFDLADRFEVLLELVLVGGTELRLEPLGIVADQVEHRLVIGRLLLAALRAGAEQAVEGDPRVDLAGQRDGGGFPGNVGRVEAGVVDVGIDAGGDRFGAEFERGQLGPLADLLGGDLVHRDAAGRDVGAGGLGDGGAGQPAAGLHVMAVAGEGGLVLEAC